MADRLSVAIATDGDEGADVLIDRDRAERLDSYEAIIACRTVVDAVVPPLRILPLQSAAPCPTVWARARLD